MEISGMGNFAMTIWNSTCNLFFSTWSSLFCYSLKLNFICYINILFTFDYSLWDGEDIRFCGQKQTLIALTFADVRYISCFYIGISDWGFGISDWRFEISDWGFDISEWGFGISESGFDISNGERKSMENQNCWHSIIDALYSE